MVFYSYDFNLHAADRYYDTPTYESIAIGFRVAKVHQPCKFMDADFDGHMTLADFAVFQNCLSGPSNQRSHRQ